mmetsp:Transcript_25915/g.54041  ORF Transcript_25915/g.54041 Transcript_25915/m.54041 type:complete len:205 (+) Transcript_25915:177-791(+)
MLGKAGRFFVIHFSRGGRFFLIGCRVTTFLLFRLRHSHGITHAGAAQFPKFLTHGIFIFIGSQHAQGFRSFARHFGKIGRIILDRGYGISNFGKGHATIQKGGFDLMDNQVDARFLFRGNIQRYRPLQGSTRCQESILFPRILIILHGGFTGIESTGIGLLLSFLFQFRFALSNFITGIQETSQIVFIATTRLLIHDIMTFIFL